MIAWKLYCDKLNNGLQIKDSQRANLNRFKARYVLAKNFKNLEISNITQKTVNGYSSLFSVFLAYNAAEKLGSSISVSILNWELNEVVFSKNVRELLSSLNLEIDEFVHDKLKENFDEFMKGDNDNIRIPASVIRNAFAHGSLTPNILKATTRKRQQILDNISTKLLEKTDQVFSNWVSALKNH
jgi:hypothetical protein